ncbi:serine/threonine-protein kinase [Geodermatophilus marinus]|uniref:serine/threonine-protein kinase n=1 Tax=Geodermatophilus sp. LHW52908 TaxID=2303986 RepID=UPI001F160880|nr:serine/threonine-protein kinase [Geodermatophilus sp. LHW52908]
MTGPGRVVAGRYRLLSRIGGGGMGAVWLARDERLGRQVAVKEVLAPPAATPAEVEQLRQRALREGRIAARLSHPHAVSVYDVALDDGAPWLVMEHLPSRSLAEVLAEDGVLPAGLVAQVGAQVADALAATHAAGIVHRDVKPANVLIGRGDRVDGLVKITDFGISHATGDVTLTRTGQITGTPAFLAPEVARGENMTPASDVFSLGATLYTCLEGRPPFGMDDNPLRLLHRVAAGDPAPPERAGPLTGVLTRMLADDPAGRPDMPAVRDELAALAAGRDGDPTTVLMARTGLRSAVAPNGTAELRAAAAPAVAAPPADPEPAAPPADPEPAPPPPPPGRPRPRRGRRTAVVAGLVLAAVLAGVLVAWWVGRDTGGAAPAATPTPSAEETGEPTTQAPETRDPQTQEPTSPTAGTSSPAEETAPAPSGPTDAVSVTQQTLGAYYALLPGDPDAAYALTGPYLQSVAGQDYYRDYWDPWAEVELAGVRDASRQDDGTVVATTEVRFTGDDGSARTELHEVRLVPDGEGGWLVDLDQFVETIG